MIEVAKEYGYEWVHMMMITICVGVIIRYVVRAMVAAAMVTAIRMMFQVVIKIVCVASSGIASTTRN